MPDIDDPEVDKQVESDTLDEEGSKTVAQQNVGPESIGGGEWPDPDTPPRGPSPGTAATGAGTEDSSEDAQFKDVLDADPVRGGSSSQGHADPADRADGGATNDRAAESS
ncbi:MAG TPA: hypothetical protein VMY88_03495 [Acidimicrobiales bacterium]|nr:hypothetical protein [Acidimicrobiales bacterium]